MTDSEPPQPPGTSRILADPFRIGHGLVHALDIASRAVQRLSGCLDGTERAQLELSQLKRVLAHADHLAHGLLVDRRYHPPIRESINLVAFVAEREPRIRAVADDGVEVMCKLFATGGPVMANTVELEEILFGLVRAANRAMPSGGQLLITTGSLGSVSGGPTSEHLRPERLARLTVSDTGAATDEDVQARVLEVSTVERGDPLASSSIASRVQRLGGHLILETRTGEGTRIHVCLPAVSDVAFRRP